MSLLVQMDSDLASVKPIEKNTAPADNPFNASSEVLKKSAELPLFAAADLLQQRSINRRRMLHLALLIIVLLFGYFSWQQYLHWQQPVNSPPFDQKIKPVFAQAPLAAANTSVPAAIIETENTLPAEQLAKLDLPLVAAIEEPLKASQQANNLAAVYVEPQPARIVSVDIDTNTISAEQAIPSAAPLFKSAPIESADERDRKTAVRANDMLVSGQTTAANTLLQQALAENPASLHSRQIYINALMAAGNYTEATAQLDIYRAYHPNSTQADYLQARLWIAQQDYRAAINLLASKAEEKFDPDRWALLGAAYQSAGHWQEAVTSYSKLLGHNRSEPRWWLGLAVAYDALNKVQQARQAYTKVLHYGHNLAPHLQDYAKSRLASL